MRPDSGQKNRPKVGLQQEIQVTFSTRVVSLFYLLKRVCLLWFLNKNLEMNLNRFILFLQVNDKILWPPLNLEHLNSTLKSSKLILFIHKAWIFIQHWKKTTYKTDLFT